MPRQEKYPESKSQENRQQVLPHLAGIPRFRLSLVCEPHPDPDHPAVQMSRPDAVAAFLFEDLEVHRSAQERMLALFLDTRNRYIAHQVAFVGTLNRCAVEPRAILQAGLLCNAAGFVLTHNHPSGDTSPSAEDLAFTRRLAEAGDVIGVRLVDHVITGAKGKWTSLRQRGAW